MSAPIPRLLVLGQLRRDYLLLPAGRPHLDIPGGNALYASVGVALWESQVGVVARVGTDYPAGWLDEIDRRGINVRGVRELSKELDLRHFVAYSDGYTAHYDNPVAHFAQRKLPYPRGLLNYKEPDERLDSATSLKAESLRQADLPAEYLHANFAHFCPVDYLTHSLMPAVLRQAGFTTLTLDPGRRYMDPAFWKYLPAILTGLTAFLTSEESVRNLFTGRSTDLWEMAEALGAYGCGMVVIRSGEYGQLLYEPASRSRWEVPAYPARIVDPTGAGDVFCGGFLAGYYRTVDPLMAVLHGSVSASISVEGTGPFYALDVLPGLPEARLQVLKDASRKV